MAEEKKAASKQQKTPAEKKATEKKPTTGKDKSGTTKLLEYKGRPLVRNGNTIYYGNINDAYIVCLNIKGSTEFKDITLADNIIIQLLSTDESLSPKDQIIKKSEKKGLYNALDLGVTWLERQLKKG